MKNLYVDYQIEPDGIFFMESLAADWCGGRIRLFNVRAGATRRDVAVKLFCDRLSLEQVLTAFGLEGVSTGGQLNGRLPIRLGESSVTVDKGFLFTTPGKGGSLSFTDAGELQKLLPAGSMQAGQLGLISAALAEFKYDWITMTLNTEEENLVVALELAGKPAEMLPFEYDPQIGTYVSVQPGSERGIRRPMHFTLNLTVPLNQLLWYTSRAQRTWETIRGH